jgi:hypothetical protein
MDGFHFYSKPLPLSKADVETLADIFKGSGPFTRYRGAKKCDGFHPDYCVEWKFDESPIQVLICFGCGEAKVRAEGSALHYDTRDDGEKALRALLIDRRQERPKSNVWYLQPRSSR